jgi:hypothetical protein
LKVILPTVSEPAFTLTVAGEVAAVPKVARAPLPVGTPVLQFPAVDHDPPPLNVQVESTTDPPDVPMMLARLLAAAVPPSVRPKVDPEIVPVCERMMFPLLATMQLALPKLINPL